MRMSPVLFSESASQEQFKQTSIDQGGERCDVSGREQNCRIYSSYMVEGFCDEVLVVDIKSFECLESSEDTMRDELTALF